MNDSASTPTARSRMHATGSDTLRRRMLLRAGAALLGGTVLTALVVMLLVSVAEDRDRRGFEADAQAAQDAIRNRVETAIALLRGVGGLFGSHGEQVTAASFRTYMERVRLHERYPGILGIGYTQRVLPNERTALETRMRAEGNADFRVWPEGDRAEVHSILFLEPLDERNAAAIGYDMYTDDVRRAAMQRARDLGMASASSVVELVQEISEGKQPGFLIYLAVYRGGAIPKTLAARRELLQGYAYAPIRAGDFLSSALNPGFVPELGFTVYHAGDGSRPVRLYDRPAPQAAEHPRFTRRATIDVSGQPWTFEFRDASDRLSALAMPLAVMLAGLALSALLAILLWRDAKARAAIEAALEREQAARNQAERANRMKDQFLATLSHELRTPLNAIVGWATALRRGGLSEEEARKGIEAVDRNARAQGRLIEDLLDMSRIVSGKVALNLQAVDAAAMLDDAVASAAPAAKERDVALCKTFGSARLALRGDPQRLQQVMWNLLSNAVKFTPSGGRVEVALERAGACARIVVTDTGEGIEPHLLAHIFDRFAQADGSITRRYGGLGLGLSIVRELVTLHGGTVHAQSAGIGQGTTFVVELPMMDIERRPLAAQSAPASVVDLAGIRVLVVDDDADARELVRMNLARHGAHVRCAASAGEAIAALAEYQPEVMLSDIGMPEMDGYELMRHVRGLPAERGGAVAAAALTAFVRDEDRAEALRAGFQMFLVKPVQPDELLVTVAALLRIALGGGVRQFDR